MLTMLMRFKKGPGNENRALNMVKDAADIARRLLGDGVVIRWEVLAFGETHNYPPFYLFSQLTEDISDEVRIQFNVDAIRMMVDFAYSNQKVGHELMHKAESHYVEMMGVLIENFA